jgi:bacillaene synthase trans-acting acyltransferase
VPKLSTVMMFSGQGSQYFQMGRAFFGANATFRNTLLELDGLARQTVGQSIVDVLYDDRRKKDEPFDAVELTSPAIFMTEYALVSALLEDGIKPDYLLAASMGLYAAAAVAKTLNPRDILQCLAKTSAIYKSNPTRGAMIAIFANPALHRELRVLRECSDIAAVNFDSHFVISTADRYVDEISEVLDSADITFQNVPVSYPFHSRWMDSGKDAAQAIFATLQYRQPTIPIVCCSQASVIEEFSSVAIWNAVRKPIDFRQTIANLEMRGPCCYIDVGPAGTLATFLKYGLPSTSTSKVFPTLSPFAADLKNYRRLISEQDASARPSAGAM